MKRKKQAEKVNRKSVFRGSEIDIKLNRMESNKIADCLLKQVLSIFSIGELFYFPKEEISRLKSCFTRVLLDREKVMAFVVIADGFERCLREALTKEELEALKG